MAVTLNYPHLRIAKLIPQFCFDPELLFVPTTKFSIRCFFVFLLSFLVSDLAYSGEKPLSEFVGFHQIIQSDVDAEIVAKAVNDYSDPQLLNEIVFIDSAIAEQSILLNSLQRNIEVVKLPVDVDGFIYIARALQRRPAFDAVHIVSHGDVGQLKLGSIKLNNKTLKNYEAELAVVRNALTKGADILLYGCNVSKGVRGQNFISALAEATNTDVLASNDLTGDAAQGGNWVLETRHGVVQTQLVFSESLISSYSSLLVDPVITSTEVIGATEDTLYSYTITANDGDDDSLVFSAPTKPDWLNFDPGSQILSGTPENVDVGSHSITLRVNDGTVDVDQSFSVTVINTNDLPVISSAEVTDATEDTPYSYIINASDVDSSDSLTYSAPTKPAWLNFNPSNRQLTGTPSNANVGAHSVTLRVNDGTVSVDQSFTVTVMNTNDVPIISSSQITSATEGIAYSYTLIANDIDVGDILSYSAPTKPTWLNFDSGTQILTGTPTNANVGSHNIVLQVTDDEEIVQQSFTVTVSNINDAPVIADAAPTAVLEDSPYSYTISATDDDGDSLTYSAPAKPSWLVFNPTNRQLAGTPSNANVGAHSVTLRVNDGTVSVDQSFTVTVTNTNDAPEITSSGITGATEGIAYSYTLVANDVDVGDNLSYSAPTKPTWLSFNSANRQLTGTPTNANVGSHNVVLEVTDDDEIVQQSFTVTVSNINDAPTITSSGLASATEDLPYSYTISATDDDGDSLTYSAPTKPGWLIFNSTNRQLTGTPSNANVGAHSVTLRVNDGTVSVNQSFTVTVTNTNDAPVISSSQITSATEGVAYSYTLIANDIDVGDNLSYSAPTKPTWLSFNSANRQLTGTPTNANVGLHNVMLRVNDGTVNVDQNFTITVMNTNDAPVITSTAVTGAIEDVSYSYTINASDVDGGDTLTYSAPILPAWLSFNAVTHQLIGTPGNVNVGIHAIRLRVNDGAVNVDQDFTIIVTNTNDVPVITSQAVVAAMENVAYSYTLIANDIDVGDNLTYSAPAIPSWLSFNPANRQLTGTPGNVNVGVHSVTLRVSDGALSVEQSFIITVGDVNNAPAIITSALTAATEDVIYSYTINATDNDGDGLIFSAPSKPDWLSFNAVTRQLSGIPANVNVGIHNVTLRVNDGTVNVDQNFIITVMNVNDIPVVTSPAVITATEDAFYSYSFTAADIDIGDTLTYSALTKPVWLSFNVATHQLSGIPTNANVGAHSVVLRVIDGTVSVNQSFIITVLNSNDVPVVSSQANTSATENIIYSYTIAATDEDISDVLTYSAPIKPVWLIFNTATHALTGTPVNTDVGVHSVTLRVSDGKVFVDQSFTVTVIDVNNNPVGVPTISGLVMQREILTANTSRISDVDVLGVFSYQWLRDGDEITGANLATYALVQADVKALISVRITYIDGGGKEEKVTSLQTTPVVNVNDLPVGVPSIIGSPIQNEALTADVSGISDEDGLNNAVFNYQWLRGGIIIDGAIASTYNLSQDDVLNLISVQVSYTDDDNALESVTSVETTAIANVNDLPVGIPVITGNITLGIFKQGEILTADTSLVTDIDGIGIFSYQWLRDGLEIVEATASIYPLTQADVNAEISVRVIYIDAGFTEEILVSDAVGPVENINDIGIVTIIGEATVAADTPLTVSEIIDTDGTTSSSFVYQWLRSGPDSAGVCTNASAGVAIDGETNDFYELTNGDLKMCVTLRVSYTDDFDAKEIIFSNMKGPVFPDVPKVAPPATIGPIPATGWFTFVDLEQLMQATARDGLDGDLAPVASSNGQFRPGENIVTWSATDSAGNVGTATQSIKVIPIAEVSRMASGAEGSIARFVVSLNGDALEYPVIVPFTVEGTASNDGSDHGLCLKSVDVVSCSIDSTTLQAEISESNHGEVAIPFEIIKDDLAEGIETIVITLDEPQNAVLGPNVVHNIDIHEGNVAPSVSLEATQVQLDIGSDKMTVTAIANDVNDEDSLDYSWSRSDNAIPGINNATKKTFSFEPADLSPGIYTLRVDVSDGQKVAADTLIFIVVEELPDLNADNDIGGDSVIDIANAFGDSDGDGIVNYLDALEEKNVIQILPMSIDKFVMQTEPGLKLKLAEVALKANHGSTLVVVQDMINFSNGNTVEPDDIVNVGGYFDFTITGLSIPGQMVSVVIPQLNAMPRAPVYRKLTQEGWQNFVENNKNTVASAQGTEGYCPPPGHTDYKPGLTRGDWCLQLTIEDGGPNDSDDITNNKITDPGGVGRVLSNVNISSGGGGGGSFNPLLLLLSILILLIVRANIRIEVRADRRT